MVGTQGQFRDNNTIRQLNVGQMQGVTFFELTHVDHQEFGQVLGQTGDGDLGHAVRDQTAGILDPGGNVFAGKMQRNSHMQLGGLADSQQIDMHDLKLVRMPLQVLEHHLLGDAIQVQGQYRGGKRLLLQAMAQRNVPGRKCNRLAVTPVNDAGHPIGQAQTAGSGLAKVTAGGGVNL